MRIVYCFLTLVSLLFVVACTETATTLPATQGIDQATMEDNLAPTESPPDPCQSWRESEGLVVILSSEGEAEEDQSEEVSALLEDGRTCPLVTIAGDGDFWVSPEARWILWFEEGYLQVHDTTSEEMRSIALSGGPMDSGRSMIFDPSQTRVAIGQIDWSTRSGETMASPKGAWRLIMVDLESGEQEYILRLPLNLLACWGRACDTETEEGRFVSLIGWSQETDEIILDLKRSVPFAEPMPESLWAVTSDGNNLRQLVEGPLQVGTSYWGKPALSPNGLNLAYFRGSGESWSLHTLDMVSGETWSTALPAVMEWFEHYSLTWLPDNERLAFQFQDSDETGDMVLKTYISDSRGEGAQWFEFEGSGTLQWCSESMTVYAVGGKIHAYDLFKVEDEVLGEIPRSRILTCWVGH